MLTKIETNVLKLAKIVNKLTDGKLISVILFGSYVRGENTRNSDYDVLFVLSDDVNDSIIRLLKKILFVITSKERIRKNGLLDRILLAIEAETGMYISGFVTKLEYLLSQKFEKVFNTNTLLSRLLAPSKIVFVNLIRNYKIVIGKDVLRPLIKSNHQPSVIDLLKSFFMNLLLSLGSIFISFKRDSIKYSLEAVKWSILAFSYAMNSPPSIRKSVNILMQYGLKLLNDLFLTARNNGLYDPRIIILSPNIVLQIHSLALKMIKNHFRMK